jgi:hypothetical protein
MKTPLANLISLSQSAACAILARRKSRDTFAHLERRNQMRDHSYSSLIHQQALVNAKTYLTSERQLLLTLIEVDTDRTFELHGFTYLTPYCIKALGLSEDIAKCLVRIVRKSHEVPELAQAVIDAKISLFKAKAISSVITNENKHEWINKARTLGKAALENEISKTTGQGKKPIRLDLTHETYDKLTRARDLLSSKLQAMATQEETLDWALTELLHRHDPVEKAARSRGHSLRHQVTRRDQETCQFIYQDGSQCEERKWLERHHIVHRMHGGEDSLENLVTLCSSHHRMVHREH